jgi:hypothetical protein
VSWPPNDALRFRVGERLAVKLKDGLGEVSGTVRAVGPGWVLIVSAGAQARVHTGAVLSITRDRGR